MGGAKFLSFPQPVAEGVGGREGSGEVVTPNLLLVHVHPEVAEIWEAFPGNAVLRGRGYYGSGGDFKVGEVFGKFQPTSKYAKDSISSP